MVFLCLCIFMVLMPVSASAKPLMEDVPSGFDLLIAREGVKLYRKEYPSGNPDYVQVINLDQGAHIALLHGDIQESRSGEGVYGGDDPTMLVKKLEKYWQEVSVDKSAVCVTSGQFFFMPEYPTRLPFPLKVNGSIISDGFGKQLYQGDQLILELWPDRANISGLTKEALLRSSAPNIIAGLAEDARKSPTKYVGRTFVGVDDRNGDGRYETVLIFSTKSARQKDAAGVLREFGADKVMMLDGGGSAQLICQGNAYVSSDRPLPQVMAIFEGDEGKPLDGGFLGTGHAVLEMGKGGEVNLFDTIWIPLAMSPFFLVLFIFIRNKTFGYE